MPRFASALAVLLFFSAAVSAQAQVVETTPSSPVRTDEPVTITFHADRGNAGLENCDCQVYAHTGLNTSEDTWRYVMDEWPENRPKTKLTKVGENTYELRIDNIRAYYSDNNTGYGEVPPKSEEEIRQLAFVFRNADGSKEGKAAGGEDISVEVQDVGKGPFLSASLQSPNADPPLYPFITATDTTVDVTVTADTANVDAFGELRLLVDGEPVDSTTADSLSYPLSLNRPNRFHVRAEATASIGDSTLADTATTSVRRAPDVVDEPRPDGVQDGINYNSDGSVTLSLFAPKKEFVYVIGDVTGWEIDNRYFMKRETTPDGAHWWLTIDGIDPNRQHDFQYYVGGASRDVRVGDPYAHKVRTPVDHQISEAVYPGLQSYPGDKTENDVSVIYPDGQQTEFQFSDFEPPKQEDLVIYELLLRDFVETSSFDVLADTLGYLDSLGVNAVELLPVSNFEGNGFWGYRPSAHLAMDKSYGPPDGLKRFVEEAHRRGIAVILDVVYNHITATSSIAQLYGSAADNPFLESGPGRGICGAFFQELNQGHPFVKEYIRRANAYWLEEFNVDGFRFDVSKCVADDGVNINDPSHSDALVSGWKAVADSMWSTTPNAYVILENVGAPRDANELGAYGGRGQTGGMLTWHNMNHSYSRADRGNLTGGSNLSSSYYRNRRGFDQPSAVTYMTSHDEQWLMRWKKARGNGTAGYSTQDFKTALNRQKLVGAFFFTVPGPRMMWQFDEVGYGWGPDECLRGFRGEDVCPESAPIRIGPKPIRWAYADSTQSPDRNKLYETWKALIQLRNDHEVFARARTGSQEALDMNVAGRDTVRCLRLEDENLDATIIGNFGLTVQTVTLEVGGENGACSFTQTGTWYNFFEDAARSVRSAQPLQLRPGEFRIYTTKEQTPPPMGLVPSAPIQRASASVSGDGTVAFGRTGVDVHFQGTEGAASTIIVEKLDEVPLNAGDVGESTVSEYRFVIETEGDLRFGNQTEIRFDVGTLGGVSDPGNVAVYSRPTEDVGSFSRLPTSYDAEANELVAETGSFSEFVLASDTDDRRVELVEFEATLTEAQTVRLSWQTASETNNDGFQVQRRVAGASGDREAGQSGGAAVWTNLEFIEGAGTTDETRSYDVTDEVPFEADSVHYRLKQVDANGSAQLIDEVTVRLGVPDRLTLRAPFPNPGRGAVTIRYAVPERQDVSLELYDVLGRRVRTLTRGPQDGRHERQLDTTGLSSGTYILRLRGKERVETRRMTVVK